LAADLAATAFLGVAILYECVKKRRVE
jgi:hypothetical protein